MTSGFFIRAATPADAAVIAAIYNAAIESRRATFETRLRAPGDVERWFDDVHPIIVAVRDGVIVGFASTSEYRARACYAGIADFGVYVAPTERGRGTGRALMVGLCAAAEAAGFWKLLSRIFTDNAASLALMRSAGFREVGIYHRHARLDGAWRDVVIVERLLGEAVEPMDGA